MAVGKTGGETMYSSNGISWSSGSCNINATEVNYATNLGFLVAGQSGKLSFSSNGLTWTTLSIGTSNWSNVIWAPQISSFGIVSGRVDVANGYTILKLSTGMTTASTGSLITPTVHSTLSKLSFYNSSPISQPTISTTTTGVSFVQNSGTTLNTDSTIGGYTLPQIVAALKNLGLLT
jgi:hypothetical protein